MIGTAQTLEKRCTCNEKTSVF